MQFDMTFMYKVKIINTKEILQYRNNPLYKNLTIGLLFIMIN